MKWQQDSIFLAKNNTHAPRLDRFDIGHPGRGMQSKEKLNISGRSQVGATKPRSVSIVMERPELQTHCEVDLKRTLQSSNLTLV